MTPTSLPRDARTYDVRFIFTLQKFLTAMKELLPAEKPQPIPAHTMPVRPLDRCVCSVRVSVCGCACLCVYVAWVEREAYTRPPSPPPTSAVNTMPTPVHSDSVSHPCIGSLTTLKGTPNEPRTGSQRQAPEVVTKGEGHPDSSDAGGQSSASSASSVGIQRMASFTSTISVPPLATETRDASTQQRRVTPGAVWSARDVKVPTSPELDNATLFGY